MLVLDRMNAVTANGLESAEAFFAAGVYRDFLRLLPPPLFPLPEPLPD
jgi:hypothetical protein